MNPGLLSCQGERVRCYGLSSLIAPHVRFRPSLSRLTRPSKVSALTGKTRLHIRSDYQKDALGSRGSLLSPLFDNAFQVCACEAPFLLLASVLQSMRG